MPASEGDERNSLLIRRIEEANFNGFPSEIVQIDGAWITRLSPGNPARRVNSLNVFDPSDDGDLEPRLARSAAMFERAGAVFRLRWTPLVPVLMTRRCDQLGWSAEGETEVLIRRIGAERAPGSEAGVLRIRVEPVAEWLQAFVEIGGTRAEAVTPLAAERLGQALARVAGEVVALVARDDAGRPHGTAVATIDRDMVGIYDVAVAPQSRRRGLGRRLVEHCIDAGIRRKCGVAWLQVTADNEVARSLYVAMGFTHLYDYHYRQPAGLP